MFEYPNLDENYNIVLKLKTFAWKYKYYFVIGLIFLVGYIYRANHAILRPSSLQQSEYASDDTTMEIYEIDVNKMLVVDVSGAVLSPGIYDLNEGSTIADALYSAGGFSEDASVEWISKVLNQAALIGDRQKIYIPYTWDISETDLTSLTEESYSLRNAFSLELAPGSPYASQVSSGDQEVPKSTATSNKSQSTVLSPEKVQINTASASELEDLPGIGEAYATKIISSRPYKDKEELVSKTKIPVATINKFIEQVEF